MADIKKLSHTHVQIMDWLIANPTKSMGACAAEFGYTPGWLSQLVHSDLFQAQLAERQEQVFGQVALTVKDRITALAHDSLERLHEKTLIETNSQTLLDTAELTLKALGFSGAKPAQQTNPGGSTVNNTLIIQGTVDKATLAGARDLMQSRAPVTLEPASLPAPPAEVVPVHQT